MPTIANMMPSAHYVARLIAVALLAASTRVVSSYSPKSRSVNDVNKPGTSSSNLLDRRSALHLPILAGSLPFIGLTSPHPANAFDDYKPSEFKNVGTQAPAPEGESPFRILDSGVKIKDFRPGTGDATAQKGTKVSLQLKGRLLNLNGEVFYDSKKNDPDGFGEGLPLTFVIGEGKAIPGLEEGVIGMKKGSIRRIIVPPSLGYDISKDLLEPVPFNALDQRALDSVIRNSRRDATLLFDVKLERLK